MRLLFLHMFQRWPWDRASASYKGRVEEVMVLCGKEYSEVPEQFPNRNNGETENTVLSIKGTTTDLWEGFYNMVHTAD